MTKILAVRHCEAAGQEPDAPLTEKGRIQAADLADKLKHYEVNQIISSPYKRAVDSIQHYASLNRLTPLIDDRLSERRLAGEMIDDWLFHLERSFSEHDIALRGGESLNEASHRILSLIEEIEKQYSGTTVIVTHGNLLSILLMSFDPDAGFHTWKAMSNPDVYEIDLSARRARRVYA